MRVTDNPQASETAGAGDKGQPKPKSRFSEVLKDERKGHAESRARNVEGQESALPEKPEKRELLGAEDAAMTEPAFVSPMPPAPSQSADVAPVGSRQIVTRPETLASLVHEITVAVPPGAAAVDIQFDSRTLDGLHVRIQKAGDSVEVRFSTASESVSRLLTANADSLSTALVQQGYVAPAISVQRPTGATSLSNGDSRQPGRGRGNGGGNQQGGRGQR